MFRCFVTPVYCTGMVLQNSSGLETGVTSAPFTVQLSNSTVTLAGSPVTTVVSNVNANGRTTSGASASPVVQPSNLAAFHLIANGTSNATVVKASGAVVYGCQTGGLSASAAWLKIFNQATLPGLTSVPSKTLIIPATSPSTAGAGSNIFFGPGGMGLPTGFAITVVGDINDNIATSVTASLFTINCDYE